MKQYAKLDDETTLTPQELVDEIYNENPDLILNVIKSNRRLPDDVSITKTEALSALVSARKLEAEDVVDGFVEAEAKQGRARGTALRLLMKSIFEAAADLEPPFESEQTLVLAFGEHRFTQAVIVDALWETRRIGASRRATCRTR